MFKNYNIDKTHNVKKTYYNFNDDITLTKTSNSYSNGTYNIAKNNNLFNIADNNYYIEKSIIHVISLTTLHDIAITIMNTM